MCRCLQSSEEDTGALEAGVTGGCEPPDLCAGNRTWVLSKSSMPSLKCHGLNKL